MTSFDALAALTLIAGIAILFSAVCDRDSWLARMVVIGLSVALIGRYMYWRLTQSVPTGDGIFETGWIYLFLVFEILNALSAVLALIGLLGYRDRRADAKRGRRILEQQPDQPLVDVLIPTYDESAAVLRRTLLGAVDVDYPDKRVWVLDDGCRDWVADLAEEYGAGYIAREDSADAKAGNLNHGLAVIDERTGAPADFICVVDADFVLFREFLGQTLGLMTAEPDAGIVQTPQHFFNPDPMQRNLLAPDCWPDEQRFFFDYVLPGKDAYGAAFCCGTSSVVRRLALDRIGGFPVASVTEDMLLSLRLSGAGWKTIYLNERLSAGLAPEGLGEYMSQRSRWCLGQMQIALGPDGLFRSTAMDLANRIGSLDSFLYWFATFPFRLLGILAPIFYWWFGTSVFDAEFFMLAVYLGPAVIANFAAASWLSRGRIQPILTDVSQLLATFEVIKGIANGLLFPGEKAFAVTAKGVARTQVTYQWPILWKIILLAALTVGGMIAGSLSAYQHGQSDGGQLVNLIWSYYNLALLGVAALVAIELPSPRQNVRVEIDEPATLALSGGRVEVTMRDLSERGARVDGLERPTVGTGSLTIEDVGAVPGTLSPQDDGTAVFLFAEPDSALQHAIGQKLFNSETDMSVRSANFTTVFGRVLQRLRR